MFTIYIYVVFDLQLVVFLNMAAFRKKFYFYYDNAKTKNNNVDNKSDEKRLDEVKTK